MNHKFKELTDLSLRVLRSTLDAAVGLTRIVPLQVYFLTVFWFFSIKTFLNIVRNTKSDYTVVQLVKAFIFFPPIVMFNIILGRGVLVFYGPFMDSVSFAIQNMISFYGVLREDFV